MSHANQTGVTEKSQIQKNVRFISRILIKKYQNKKNPRRQTTSHEDQPVTGWFSDSPISFSFMHAEDGREKKANRLDRVALPKDDVRRAASHEI
jgi:hypothetical protein